MKLSDTFLIPVLHENLFRVTQALHKGLQVTSEGDALMLRKNSNHIRFDKKMANSGGKGFLLTTNLSKGAKNASILAP